MPPERRTVPRADATQTPRMFIEEEIAYGLTRELALYERFLEPDEPALIVASASRFIRPGLLIVTDRRALFLRHPLLPGNLKTRTIEYENIRAVRADAWSDNQGVVRLTLRRGKVVFRYLPHPAADAIAETIMRIIRVEISSTDD